MKQFTTKFFVICLIILLAGCKKEHDAIGLGLRESGLGNADCDTSTIVAYSLRADSINTTNLTNVMAGALRDPVFGDLNVGFYAKYLLSTVNVGLGSNAVFDSLVLTIQYSGYYGDTLSDMQLQVYEMDRALNNSTIYYSNQKEGYLPTNLLYNPSSTFRPKPNTIISNISDTIIYPAHIRVRLSDDLGRRLFNDDVLKNNEALHRELPGLYITATSTSSPGCLLYFNLRASISAINLHYHDDKGSHLYILTTPSSTVNYTSATIDHDRSSDQNFKGQVLQGDKELGKQYLYAQALGGVRTYINFPYLYDTYHGKDVIINKAELVIPVIADDNFLTPPPTMTMQMILPSNNVDFVPDNLIGSSYFGGTYDATEKCYRFRITKYVQQMIQSPTYSKGIYLIVSGSGVRGNRLKFYGTDPNPDADKRIRLDLYYTKY